MTPETRSGLWTLLIILAVAVAAMLIIAALDRADAFNYIRLPSLE
jgi:hypothetical protein